MSPPDLPPALAAALDALTTAAQIVGLHGEHAAPLLGPGLPEARAEVEQLVLAALQEEAERQLERDCAAQCVFCRAEKPVERREPDPWPIEGPWWHCYDGKELECGAGRLRETAWESAPQPARGGGEGA